MNQRQRKVIDRRTLLRGAGTVAIALPFLEEMVRPARAAQDAPQRCITLFFGLGMSPEAQKEGFSGPLAPYQPFKDKMAFFRDVDMTQAKGGTAHFEGSPVIFVGEKKRGQDASGGGSIDQLVRRGLHPNGVPTALGTVAAGLWFREGCACQPLRCWNPDGSVAEKPIKRPSDLFAKIFGDFKAPMPPDTGATAKPDPGAMREARIKRSVLDTVMEQYQSLAGKNSYLGAASKEKIATHLDRIREVEKKLAPADETVGMMQMPTPVSGPGCRAPGKPIDPDLDGVGYALKGQTDGSAPVIAFEKFNQAFGLLGEVYAMGLKCDIFRFGNLMCESAGGHVSFTGTYNGLGQSLRFPGDSSAHASFWHGNKPDSARLCTHMFQTNLAAVLAQLDDKDALEANGKTVLDNTTVVIGTEVGWNHSLDSVFHGVVGGGGRFKPGFYDQAVNATDVYNSVLSAHGLPANIGKSAGLGKGGVTGLLR